MLFNVSDLAREDLKLQHLWYAEQAGLDIADAYLDTFETTAPLLTRFSDAGKLCHYQHAELQGLRRFHFEKPYHKHLIFYRVEIECVEVIRIIHGVRDLPSSAPGPTRSRVR